MNNQYLIHFGILGQKWGVRRYQNEDGTLTEEGKKRHKAQSELLAGAKYHALKNVDYYNKMADEHESDAKMFRDQPIDKSIELLWGDKRAALIAEHHDENRIKQLVSDASDKHLRDAQVNRDLARESRTLLWQLSYMQADVLKDDRQFMKEIEDLFGGNNKGLLRQVMLEGLRDDVAKYRGLSDNEKRKYVEKEKRALESPIAAMNRKFDAAKKDRPDLTMDQIYREMGVDMSSEDHSVYKDAEREWYKKHGY